MGGTLTSYTGKMKTVEYPIISCSRRTDIPAHLMSWVLDKIKSGYVDVRNPFNPLMIQRVILKPTVVKCWVWWSKDFSQWIKAYYENLELFRLFKGHFFQFTINTPCELESGVKASLDERINQLKILVEEFSPSAVTLRFDPIVFYRNAGSTQVKNNLSSFEYIVKKAAELNVKELVFSFIALYPKVVSRMISRGKIPIRLSLEEKQRIIENLLIICRDYEITLKACCQPELLDIIGIQQSRCIDAYKIERLIKTSLPKVKDKGQRVNCACHRSIDIGGYTGFFSCKHNCDYCYGSPK
ncbi:MAG: DUF1848 domain-containing protein [Candidatus Odinarchaeum yellowstonii]|uniref:DUF1848 domain-containing protein n=1 Tax=Odinarchaeota yellowstonii (strain LCB_4) TaxID=1841599 RepID=A0AAF0IBZ1_ODILC|nr:MAG: DUF1848 domain-containing protein [Candidatus Odinarchaeum yellowstonii]